MIPASVATTLLDSLSGEAERLSAFRSGRNLCTDWTEDGRHLDLPAADGLTNRDRKLDVDIIALALKKRMRTNVDHDEEVSRWSSLKSSRALSSKSDPLAVAHPFGDLHVDLLGLYDHPELLAELRRLRTRFAAGQAAVVNPHVGGSHGDLAQALALAVYEHDRWGLVRGDGHWQQRGQPATIRLDELERLMDSTPTHDGTRTPRWYDRAPGLAGRIF